MPGQVLDDLRATARSRPIIVAGVGCGLTAQGAAAGGADVLATYSTAVYRRYGLPTALSFLPYDDANALTFGAAPEVLMNAAGRPVLLGIGAHDPRTPLERQLDRVASLGAAGVTNEPFVGIYGADIRAELDRAGLGFSREVELIRRAAARGMLTLGWSFRPDEARAMAQAGAGMIGAMLGITGAAGGDLAQALAVVDAIVAAATAERADVLVLAHGGILGDRDSVAAFLARSAAHGYVTGSSAERQPVIAAVAEAVRRFRRIERP